MALRRAGNAELAEDLVQEAFLSLAERLDAGREVGDIPAFLRWTVGARLIDIQRGRPSTARLAMRDCISLDALSVL